MAPEIVDLTHDSPPASPKTPKSTLQPLVGSSSSSAPAVVMQKKRRPCPSLEQQPNPKRLRASSEPNMENRNQSTPPQLGLERSSSENDITRLGTQPMFDDYRLQCNKSKVQLTEAEQHKFLKESSESKRPVDCTTGANDTGSLRKEETSEKTSETVGELRNLRELIEYAKQIRKAALMPSSLVVAAPPVSAPPVFAPLAIPVQALPFSSRAVTSPLVYPAYSEWVIPETLRLFPVETPFFPTTSERGGSSRAARDDYVAKRPGDRDDYVNLDLKL